jgi:ethanolamine ammonia-lyase large subunit
VRELSSLDAIKVPAPRPPETYRVELLGERFAFEGLKALLGAADLDKAGDRNAGLAARREVEREAARHALSGLTIGYLYDNPLTDADGKIDSVMRVNYDIDRAQLSRVSALTVGELKDRLLRAPGIEVRAIGRGLTGVMAAAVAKLMDVHELVAVAARISCPTRARTVLGLPDTLSSRLQPNHPVDDPRGITLLTYVGLSMASGDALIGLNPSIDTVENTTRVLELLDRLRRETGAPTQVCCLSHVKTQLMCLERGVPVEVMFQSLAGTDRTLVGEFDCTVELLDRAWRAMRDGGPLKGQAEQFMYFETGQGSEFTYGKHDGIDMATLEGLCYGLARRWDPYMVNNVTGFIGPETHLGDLEMIGANLQDHFMGKLLGLPMGMAPCYTLHSGITLEGQQMATQLLTAAGANYYMDVCLNTDRMLAYFDTSGHDDQTLREVHGKTPAPQYLEWALGRGILAREGGEVVRGPAWGDPRTFGASQREIEDLAGATPALYGFDNAGPRPANRVTRLVRLNQALAREAVHADLDLAALARVADFRTVETRAASRAAHLNGPALGAQLSDASRAALAPEPHRVQVVVTDGLSAKAVMHSVPELLPVLLEGLAARKRTVGRPLLARFGRVKLCETVADALACDLVVMLVGERPGGDALSSKSLSAYLALRLPEGSPRFEYTVVSNIYAGGLPPAEAAGVLVERIEQILEHRAAGNRLEEILKKAR